MMDLRVLNGVCGLMMEEFFDNRVGQTMYKFFSAGWKMSNPFFVGWGEEVVELRGGFGRTNITLHEFWISRDTFFG